MQITVSWTLNGHADRAELSYPKIFIGMIWIRELLAINAANFECLSFSWLIKVLAFVCWSRPSEAELGTQDKKYCEGEKPFPSVKQSSQSLLAQSQDSLEHICIETFQYSVLPYKLIFSIKSEGLRVCLRGDSTAEMR